MLVLRFSQAVAWSSIFCFLSLLSPVMAQAQGAPLTPSSISSPAGTATSAADASSSAEATASATVVEPTPQPRNNDLTETAGPVKSRLARVLDDNPIGPLSPANFVQYAIRNAVNQGVPANILVLLLLFPVIASLIAVSRHLIGLEGFGVYTPAILSVALLSTGILTGLLLFSSILVLVTVGRYLVKPLKLQYLPRTALLLWFVSLGTFGLLLAAPLLQQVGINLIAITIFPLLVLILLSENFMEVTFSSSQTRAIELTLETIALAIASTLIIRTQAVQNLVILHPEMTLLFVLATNILVGRYTGLRVTEYFRFKGILDPEEE